MRLCPDTHIYIGPPGCGKTTTLICRVTELIESGVPPERIGYVSFTRQAIHEAIRRIVSRTQLPKDKFRHFRTLHSMAFYLLGCRVQDMVDQAEDSRWSKEATDCYSHLYNYHRVTGMPLEEVWATNFSPTTPGDEYQFGEWIKYYEGYKRITTKMDFTDLLLKATEKKPYMPFDWLFVDEAQDLTPSQWHLVKVLAENTDHLVIAGDPDQSIFSWAGADGDILENLEGTREVLSQSYRVPKKVHTFAERILRATGRDILYSPTPNEGMFEWCNYHEVMEMDFRGKESYYILCRNNYYLEEIAAKLYRDSIWYSRLGENHNTNLNMRKYTRLIDRYNKLLRDEQVNMDRLEADCRGASSCLRYFSDRKKPWWEAFDLWPIDRTQYLRDTVDDWDSNRVRIGTFHASKGGEADNVILLGDTTSNSHEAILRGSIPELRAMYVAVTRAKKRLVVVKSNRKQEIPWQNFINIPQDLINGLL